MAEDLRTDNTCGCGDGLSGFAGRNQLVRRVGLFVFALWSAVFIYRSSVLAADGHRYWSLFDDAMISMRFARNLATGHGLVWNSGERVEGFTNLAWTLLMSAANTMPRTWAVLSMHIIGVLTVVTVASMTLKISHRVTALLNFDRPTSELHATLAFLSVLAYHPLAFWSIMGMETGALAVAVCGMTLLAINHNEDRKLPSRLGMGAWIALAFTLRPDGVIYGVPITLFLLMSRRLETPRELARQVVEVWLLPAISILGVSLFRWLYYGSLVPNTYVLKMQGVPVVARLIDGIVFVTPWVLTSGPLLALAAIALASHRNRILMLLLLMTLLSVAYQVWVGGDPWAYWRQMVPTMPGLIVAAVVGADSVACALVRRHTNAQGRRLALAALSVIFAAGVCLAGARVITAPPLKTLMMRLNPALASTLGTALAILSITAATVAVGWIAVRFVRLNRSTVTVAGLVAAVLLAWAPFAWESLTAKPFQAGANAENIETAVLLNAVLQPDDSIGVYWAGTIPYYTDFRAVDFLGKSDSRIARVAPDLSGSVGAHGMRTLPGHNKYDLDYSIGVLRPTYVQGFEWGDQNRSDLQDAYYETLRRGSVTLFLRKDRYSN